MHGLTLLRDLVILVGVAIPVVALAHRLRIPSIVGFLISGLIIGPHALGLIGEPESVRGLAELGVVLLLFTIGLELSLARIIKLGRDLVLAGGLQVVGTITLVALFGVMFGTPWRIAIVFGALVALSSTAVVLTLYKDRGELDSPHGRVVVAILIFQDLCVVPLMLLLPILAGSAVGGWESLRTIGISLGVVGALVVGGRIAIPWVLERLVGTGNLELFTLAIVFCGLGAAYVTASFGLSLALGAFIAGLVISESEFSIQALSDVLPFRDTFSGIFFISIGMLLDVEYVAGDFVTTVAVAAGVIVLKAVVAAIAARMLPRPVEVSVITGLGLAQVGEFSFVLAAVALPLGLLPAAAYQTFLGASFLSVLATPFVIDAARPVAAWFCRLTMQPAAELLPHEKKAIANLTDHVVVVGFGVNGHNLARVLKASEIPYVILEQSGQTLRRGRLAGEPIYFGDGTRREVLERVGLPHARVIVYAISSPADERRGAVTARLVGPNVKIIVRTRFVSEVGELLALGADEVIPEEFETSIEIFSRVLRMYGVPGNVIQAEMLAVRGEHYEMLRTPYDQDGGLHALQNLGAQDMLTTLLVEDSCPAIGGNPVSLDLRRQTGTTVIAVIRDGVALHAPDPTFGFRAGDTVVLVGDRAATDKARDLFRSTPETIRGDGPQSPPTATSS